MRGADILDELNWGGERYGEWLEDELLKLSME